MQSNPTALRSTRQCRQCRKTIKMRMVPSSASRRHRIHQPGAEAIGPRCSAILSLLAFTRKDIMNMERLKKAEGVLLLLALVALLVVALFRQ